MHQIPAMAETMQPWKLKMDRRCREILDILLKENRPIPARVLTDAFQITGRAVRYDLRRLDEYLTQYGLPPLSRNSSGIKLQNQQAQNELLLSLIAQNGEGVCFFDHQRRAGLMELDLLLARDFVRIGDLCAKYAVSRSTVVNDLHRLRRGRSDRIAIRGYPRRGFRVEAEERDIRLAIVACLLALIPQDEAVDSLWPRAGCKPQSRCLDEAVLHSPFRREDFAACAKVAARLEEELSAIWSDHSLLRVCYALLVCLMRARQGAELPAGLSPDIARTRDYAIVRNVIKNCQKELGGSVTPEDLEFIALYALCAETHNISYFRKENHIQLELCAARMLKSLKLDPGTSSLEYSHELQDNLSEFLSHSFYRIKYGLPPACASGPAPSALRRIIKALPAALAEFTQFSGKPMPRAEVKALASLIYEARALEGGGRFATFRAIVILGEKSPGRAVYMAALRANFPQIDVTAVIVRHEAPHYQLSRDNLDFIISTAPLRQSNLPEFVISDMDSARETAELRKYLASSRPRRKGGACDTRTLLRNVLKAADSVCEREVYDRFVTALSERVGPVEYLYYRGDVSVMLKDMLQLENIQLDVAADGWEAAVRLCGNILVEKGYVEPRFVEAMVKLVQENGPYIVIAPGLAFPHARPQDGAKIMGMSLIRLVKPVEFGNEDNDPVRLVIALSATDSSSHIEALAELFEVIAEEENRDSLLQAATPEEIMAVFDDARSRRQPKQQNNKP